jgi:hypothetical protein
MSDKSEWDGLAESVENGGVWTSKESTPTRFVDLTPEDHERLLQGLRDMGDGPRYEIVHPKEYEWLKANPGKTRIDYALRDAPERKP